MKSFQIRRVIVMAAAAMFLSTAALGLSPPHDSSNSIECVTCHALGSEGSPDGWIQHPAQSSDYI